jgi:N-acyl-L-homoserine lactone synthetase
MNSVENRQRAVFFMEREAPALLAAVQRFRTKLFVDELGWQLTLSNGQEKDQFDVETTVHCALLAHDEIVGCFRAIRADRPYLAEVVFKDLAEFCTYPIRPDMWEISRFGVASAVARFATARVLYGLMFRFAQTRNADALVAIADLSHERFLRFMGIRTRRYGRPRVIGVDDAGRPIEVVAGEIPLVEQQGERFQAIMKSIADMEIIDETLVFGRSRISA